MLKGVFIVVPDEKMGLKIKYFHYTEPINLTYDFVSKIFETHLHSKSSTIESEFTPYKIISYFTGGGIFKGHEKSVIGIILNKDEQVDNLELFLQRNLDYGLLEQDNQSLNEFSTIRLPYYLKLNQLLKQTKIEDISEILIITGDKHYKSTLFRLGTTQNSESEIPKLYDNIINNKLLNPFIYYKLDINIENNVFLILRTEKISQKITEIFSAIKIYLENFFYYTLEILALFLLVPVITLIPLKSNIETGYFDECKSLLEILEQSQNYGDDFNNIFSLIINDDIYLTDTQINSVQT